VACQIVDYPPASPPVMLPHIVTWKDHPNCNYVTFVFLLRRANASRRSCTRLKFVHVSMVAVSLFSRDSPIREAPLKTFVTGVGNFRQGGLPARVSPLRMAIGLSVVELGVWYTAEAARPFQQRCILHVTVAATPILNRWRTYSLQFTSLDLQFPNRCVVLTCNNPTNTLQFGLSASRTSAGRDHHHTPSSTQSPDHKKYTRLTFRTPHQCVTHCRQEFALAAHCMLTSILGFLGPLVPNVTFPGVVTLTGFCTHTL
jgi:hypothetical protein